MKVKSLLLAVAGVLISSQAFAQSPAQILAAKNANALDQTWVSGASASAQLMYEGYLKGCDAGTMSIYTNATGSANTPGSIGNFAAYACKRAGKVSVVYHTMDGGSLNAFLPHTTGAFVNRLSNLANATCTTSSNFNGAPVYKGCALTTATAYPLSADQGPTKPAGGFSDVESAAFGAIAGNVAAAGTESEALVGQTFGLAVSTNLYRALQTAQGINVAADPTFDPVNAPNITTAQYTSIVDQAGGYHTDWAPILGATGAGKKIVLARRPNTSGSQASSNIHFLHNPCASGVSGAAFPATPADSIPGAFEVSENSGTSDVKVALTSANTAGNYAIGVVSLENDWRIETNAARSEYRFVKLDGVHPEAGSQQGTQNVPGAIAGAVSNYYTARVKSADGSYPFHMEMRYFVANSADAFGAAVIPQIVSDLAQPTNCSATPRGMTLNPLGGAACGNDVVTKGTKFGNNCKANGLFF